MTARALLPYQRHAVQKHLAVRNGAEFSVPGAGKTMVALAYWDSRTAQFEPDLGLWVIGPLSCFRPWRKSIRRVSELLHTLFGSAERRMNALSSWIVFITTILFSVVTIPLGEKNGLFAAHWTAGRGCWFSTKPTTSN